MAVHVRMKKHSAAFVVTGNLEIETSMEVQHNHWNEELGSDEKTFSPYNFIHL